MGLFNLDDPQQAAMMALASGLLSGKGNLGGIAGNALMQGQNAGMAAQASQQERNLKNIEMQRLQALLDQQRRAALKDKSRTDLAPQFLTTPQTSAASLPGGPTNANAAQIPNMHGGFDVAGYARALMGRGDLEGASAASALEKADLIPNTEHGYLQRSAGYKQVGGAPKLNDFQKMLQAANIHPGSPLYTQLVTDWLKKQSSHPQPITVPINVGEKNMFGNMGEAISKRIDSALIAGDAANQSIFRLQGLRDALNNKEIISGAGADARIVLSRIGKLIGAGGRTESETLANTAQVVQQLASLELDAAKGMRGQGQITDNERKLIRKAAAGDINMTVDELKALVSALDRQARFTIKWANDFTGPARQKAKGTVMEPYLQIQEPADDFRIEKL